MAGRCGLKLIRVAHPSRTLGWPRAGAGRRAGERGRGVGGVGRLRRDSDVLPHRMVVVVVVVVVIVVVGSCSSSRSSRSSSGSSGSGGSRDDGGDDDDCNSNIITTIYCIITVILYYYCSSKQRRLCLPSRARAPRADACPRHPKIRVLEAWKRRESESSRPGKRRESESPRPPHRRTGRRERRAPNDARPARRGPATRDGEAPCGPIRW